METKRIFLAVVLCSILFIGWNFLSLHMGWIPEPQEASEQAAPAPVQEAQVQPADPAPEAAGDPSGAASALPAFVPTQGRPVTVDTPLYKAVFHSGGGILRSFELKRYRVSLGDDAPLVNVVNEAAAGHAPFGVLVDGKPSWIDVDWALEGDDLSLDEDGFGTLAFSAQMDGMRLTRVLEFSGANYAIKEKLHIQAESAKSPNLAFTFAAGSLTSDKRPGVFDRLRHAVFGGAEPEDKESQYNITRIAWYQNGSFDEENSESDLAAGLLQQGKVSWMAVMNNYFMGAVSMGDDSASAKGRFLDGVYHVLIGKSKVSVAPGSDASLECAYFLGPKEARQLEATPNNMGKALDYGFFSVIAKPLVFLLDFFYRYVHNYGVAIVLMTILIKIIFWPLSQKSYKSMQQMKQLQPMMAKLREKHAGDKEAMNREIMQLYKTYKVNPAGGCLPILVQIPVFFGLYQALLNAIELRHAPFVSTLPFTDQVWLADLAAPDPFLITPLVMGATMFLQQKMTPAPGDPTQAKVMMFMPLIFTFLFLGFPSGLVVYWLVNNVISIGQQWWQLRRTSS